MFDTPVHLKQGQSGNVRSIRGNASQVPENHSEVPV
jgi:hypothetical protein